MSVQTLRLLPWTIRLHQTELSTAKNLHLLQELAAISEAISLIFILVNLCLWISLEIRHVWYIPKSNSMWALLRICSRSLEKEKKNQLHSWTSFFCFLLFMVFVWKQKVSFTDHSKNSSNFKPAKLSSLQFFSCFNFVLQVLRSLFHDHLHLYWTEYFRVLSFASCDLSCRLLVFFHLLSLSYPKC